jgi:hypothetical protein
MQICSPPRDAAGLLYYLRVDLSCHVWRADATLKIAPTHRCPPAVVMAAQALREELVALIIAEEEDRQVYRLACDLYKSAKTIGRKTGMIGRRSPATEAYSVTSAATTSASATTASASTTVSFSAAVTGKSVSEDEPLISVNINVRSAGRWLSGHEPRTTPALLGLYSLVTVWAHGLMHKSSTAVRSHPTAWGVGA